MEGDPWVTPYSIKVVNNFLNDKYYSFLDEIIQNRSFYKATQGIGSNQIVQENHKIRLDYTFSMNECSVIDKPLVKKAECNCNLRERWRLLYYDGDADKKAFRDAHTDWTSHSCHRRMSIIIGLSEPSEYEGGELVFANYNLKYKIGKGSAVIFDSKLLHEVLPVTKGKRYVLQAFLFDESGWDLKKVKNGYNNFKLLGDDDFKEDDDILKNDKWDTYDNKNAVHGKISSYEGDYLGTFNYIKDVYNTLENLSDKIYFTWHKPTNTNKKWKGRLYAWDDKTCKFKNRTDPESWPKEIHTVSGKKILSKENLNLEMYHFNSKKHLALISTDGGPGNQIVGIKEGLIISEILNREFIFPPIIQHYMLNRSNRGTNNNIKYWNFSDIFNYNNDSKINNLVDNIKLIESNTKNIYCVRQQDVSNKLRMETIFNLDKFNKLKLKKNRFSNENDIKLLNYDENVLVISHLYNNLKISNCFWNGCDTCSVNPDFIDLYKKISNRFDFSDKIKNIGDKYIKENLSENFISIHIRYHDVYKQNIKEINKLYDETDIKILIDNLKKDKNTSVFVATNKQNRILESDLNESKLLPKSDENDELESFIEQYICCKSKTFIYSGGIHAKPEHTHLRSTWSSFVLDYRYSILNIQSEDNIYLSNYFSNNTIKSGYKY